MKQGTVEINAKDEEEGFEDDAYGQEDEEEKVPSQPP
jgi:hypothetical protein